MAFICIAGILLLVSGYYFADLNLTQEDSLNIEILQDEINSGDIIRISVTQPDNTPVEGAEIIANDGRIGTTNENGIQGYPIPEDIETLNITARYQGEKASLQATVDDGTIETEEERDQTDEAERDSEDSEDREQITEDSEEETTEEETIDDSEEEQRDGFIFQSEIVAEESNRVLVYNNGERVLNEQVNMNGEVLGNTGQNGAIVFTVPNTPEITLDTVSAGEETFTVKGFEEDETDEPSNWEINPRFEITGGESQGLPDSTAKEGETITLDASPTSSLNEIENYNWEVNEQGEPRQFEGEQTSFSAGSTTHFISLEIEDIEGFSESVTQTLEIEERETYEGPSINLQYPEGEVDGPEELFQFDVTNAKEGQSYSVVVDNQEAYSGTLNEGGNSIEEAVQLPVEGETEYFIEIDGERTYSSESKGINIGRAWNSYGTFQTDIPGDFENVENPVEFGFNADLSENVEFTLYISGEQKYSTNIDIEEDIEENYYSVIIGDIETGEKEWYSEIKPLNTEEESIRTENRTIGVEE